MLEGDRWFSRLHYSDRKASIGSNFAARCAGRYAPNRATMRRSTITTANVTGSSVEIPNRKLRNTCATGRSSKQSNEQPS